ncbi:HWE histidine kinase domain-containing protein [Paracoccus sp. T5]|uniref:HWE histidine kinase domain-containing protein n=1 Tax=Paracoccus sp. T5 TaxID=3402161 RepID=UPI003AEC62EB
MTSTTHDFQTDLDLIASIPAVSSILDVVCQMTGMGFSAVARVTEGRWIACATRDEIGFGLAPGDELPVETTICHEIRQTPAPVIIENVSEDEGYSAHETPLMYGFQSYVSFPIHLPDGDFFGTLCAIDPVPRRLKSLQTIATLELFAELIGQHLDGARKLARTERLLEERRNWERQQRVIQREIIHRMKNTLTMIQAVVTQSLRTAATLEEAAASVTDRVRAMARAQDFLTEHRWDTADIHEIVEGALAPHSDGGDRFIIEGDSAEVNAQQIMGLALALHELSTNAVKYGALSNEQGRIHILWKVAPDKTFTFLWEERGGPDVAPPSRKGFGARLTERVVPSYFDGHAELRYAPEGVRYKLTGSL